MLGRSITYRLLLRVAGILLLLWALYVAFQIATQQSYVGDAMLFILGAGVLLLAAAAILLLGFSFRHPPVVYWSIQVALWFAGISLWYKFNQAFVPWPQNPLWLIVTVICSVILLALYKPVIHLIRKLALPTGGLPSPT
ncbi:MAG: hypothetical protein WCD86_04935 [Ktedonobacteraceae bacterium]